ncbi:MAG TPA: rhodanese-like domain-containing protein [Phycisphaerales bacterium]|nr:rhodanese-like domain-containing protein [Phycisphaerales bacterium]
MTTPTPTPGHNENGLPAGYPFKPQYEVTVNDAKAQLASGSLLIIDCRTQEEWDVVRVPGTVHIPLDQIEKRHDEVEPQPGQRVAVLCHHGVRSMRAALALRALGHGDVLSVAGGIDAWSLAADPSVRRYERGPSGSRLI